MVVDARAISARPAWIVAFAVVLFAIVCLVYWPGVLGGFVFDDNPNIVENAELHVTTTRLDDWLSAAFSSPSSDLRRPLAMSTFAANHFFTGLDPAPMKIANILIHAFNALLVFLLARELYRCLMVDGEPAPGADRVALLAAGFWALNPINVMAVLYVVQRMESLSHTCVFLALIAYVRIRRRPLQTGFDVFKAGLALIAGSILGLMSKESAVLTPLYAFLMELTLLPAWQGRLRRSLALMYAVVLWLPATLATLLLWRRSIAPNAYGGRNFTLIERLLTEPRVVLDYLQWAVLPRLQSLGLAHDDYPVSHGLLAPPSTLIAILLVAALAGVAIVLRRRCPMLALGLLWFLGAQVLTATFIPLELVFEHRNYFASLGIALALSSLLLFPGIPGKWRTLGLATFVALLLHGAFTTWLRAKEWSSPFAFATAEAAKRPNSPRATYDKARMLIVMGNYERTSRFDAQALAALEAARRAPNAGVLPVQAALIYAARTGRPVPEEWWSDITAQYRTAPLNAQNLGALAALVKCSNLTKCDFPAERMLALFGTILARGDHPEVLNIYGSYALSSLHDPQLTLKAWETAAQLRPEEPQYRINLAQLYTAAGNRRAAREQIAALRRLGRLGEYESAARALSADPRLAPSRTAEPAAGAGSRQ